jgi:phenylpropionate dioxygenase-like ring-hydroxylating dioxygenase large terminal subunit/putative sterol carrier protein
MNVAAAPPRFPFSYPSGWFVVATAQELVPGELLKLRYFGRELVAFRGESGKACVIDAYCPHLGAHLAYGGVIEGECVRCPFHGWKFDGQGRCVEVPYSDRIPPKAAIDAWPVLEQDGLIFVFYGRPGEQPWPMEPLDPTGYTAGKMVHWRDLATHPQEVFENTVDITHIGPVHNGRKARILGKPEREGPTMVINLEFLAPGDIVGMPDQLNDVHLHVTMRGLGAVIVQTHVRNVDTWARQRLYATPVDETHIDIRGIVHVRETDDPVFTEELAELFYRAYVEDFAKDFPIWENKRYLTRPTLAKGDGPVGVYRRWCAQFYGDEPELREHELREPARAEAQAGHPRVDVAVDGLLRRLSGRVVGRVPEQVIGTARTVLAEASRRLPALEVPLSTLEAVLGSGARASEAERRDDDDLDEDWSPSEASRETASEPESSPLSGGGIRVASAEEYFETLAQRFVPAAAKGVEAVYQWELGGAAGRTFHAIVRDGELEVHAGAHAKPTVALVMDAEDYVKVVNGELDGMRAFTSGRGKVKGSVRAAMKMRALFPAA